MLDAVVEPAPFEDTLHQLLLLALRVVAAVGEDFRRLRLGAARRNVPLHDCVGILALARRHGLLAERADRHGLVLRIAGGAVVGVVARAVCAEGQRARVAGRRQEVQLSGGC